MGSKCFWSNSDTSGLGLNASGIGGIGGDYGGSNPALVSFVDTSSRYDFYDDRTTSTWAYQRSRGLDIAAGPTSTTVCQIRFGGSGSYTLTLPPSLPASNRSAIVLDSTGAMLKNDATNTITNTLYVASDINLVSNGNIIRGTRYIEFAPQRGVCQVTAGALNTNTPLLAASGGSTTVKFALPELPRGATISTINVRGYKSTAGLLSFQLSTVVLGASAVETETNIGSAGTTTTSGVYVATQNYTQVISQYESYRITLVLPANTDSCWCVEIGIGGNL